MAPAGIRRPLRERPAPRLATPDRHGQVATGVLLAALRRTSRDHCLHERIAGVADGAREGLERSGVVDDHEGVTYFSPEFVRKPLRARR